MKLMVLTGSYWPSQDGVAQVTEYLAEGLAKKHEVYLMSPYGNSVKKFEEFNGVKIERIAAKRRYSCGMVGDKETVLNRIQEYNPDILIVIGIQNWGFDWIKGKLDKLPGKKVLMTHGSSCLGKYSVWNQIKQIKFRRQILADILRVYMEWYWKRYQKSFPRYMAQYDMITYLFDKEPLYLYMRKFPMRKEIILENAVEDIFFERRAFLIDNEKSIVFINVSNYEIRKNQKMILKAYGELNLPQTRLILIGSKENEYYNKLLEMKEHIEKGSDFQGQINIYAGISRERVLELYEDADVYVSASNWEAMSISLCEAAAGGLLILSTDVGHVSRIPGVQLFQNEEELKYLMSEAYKNPDMRREGGMRANAYAEENYRIQKKVDQLEEELTVLCGG